MGCCKSREVPRGPPQQSLKTQDVLTSLPDLPDGGASDTVTVLPLPSVVTSFPSCQPDATIADIVRMSTQLCASTPATPSRASGGWEFGDTLAGHPMSLLSCTPGCFRSSGPAANPSSSISHRGVGAVPPGPRRGLLYGGSVAAPRGLASCPLPPPSRQTPQITPTWDIRIQSTGAIPLPQPSELAGRPIPLAGSTSSEPRTAPRRSAFAIDSMATLPDQIMPAADVRASFLSLDADAGRRLPVDGNVVMPGLADLMSDSLKSSSRERREIGFGPPRVMSTTSIPASPIDTGECSVACAPYVRRPSFSSALLTGGARGSKRRESEASACLGEQSGPLPLPRGPTNSHGDRATPLSPTITDVAVSSVTFVGRACEGDSLRISTSPRLSAAGSCAGAHPPLSAPSPATRPSRPNLKGGDVGEASSPVSNAFVSRRPLSASCDAATLPAVGGATPTPDSPDVPSRPAGGGSDSSVAAVPLGRSSAWSGSRLRGACGGAALRSGGRNFDGLCGISLESVVTEVLGGVEGMMMSGLERPAWKSPERLSSPTASFVGGGATRPGPKGFSVPRSRKGARLSGPLVSVAEGASVATENAIVSSAVRSGLMMSAAGAQRPLYGHASSSSSFTDSDDPLAVFGPRVVARPASDVEVSGSDLRYPRGRSFGGGRLEEDRSASIQFEPLGDADFSAPAEHPSLTNPGGVQSPQRMANSLGACAGSVSGSVAQSPPSSCLRSPASSLTRRAPSSAESEVSNVVSVAIDGGTVPAQGGAAAVPQTPHSSDVVAGEPHGTSHGAARGTVPPAAPRDRPPVAAGAGVQDISALHPASTNALSASSAGGVLSGDSSAPSGVTMAGTARTLSSEVPPRIAVDASRMGSVASDLSTLHVR